MLRATTASRGMIVAPHHLAAQAGLSVLREGGNAIEAIVAAAATIAVVYPHMNGLGGDGFWLIKPARGQPLCVLAAGRSGANVTPEYFSALGLSARPRRAGKRRDHRRGHGRRLAGRRSPSAAGSAEGCGSSVYSRTRFITPRRRSGKRQPEGGPHGETSRAKGRAGFRHAVLGRQPGLPALPAAAHGRDAQALVPART